MAGMKHVFPPETGNREGRGEGVVSTVEGPSRLRFVPPPENLFRLLGPISDQMTI